MRRYDALMALTALVVAAHGALVVLVDPHPVLQGVTAVLRLAALAALWRTLPRAAREPESWWPLVSYVAALFAVVGGGTVGNINALIWPPTCTPTVPDYTFADITDRVLTALSGGPILWAWWTTVRAEHGHTGRRFTSIRVAGIAAVGAFACYVSAAILNHVIGTRRWCPAFTDQAFSPIHLFVTWLLAGPNEELVFTGLGLAMLTRARWPVVVAGLLVNVFFRLSIHLYYANQETVLLWLLWVAVWSGPILLYTLVIGRRAIARGMPLSRSVLACTVGVVVTHSFVDLL